MRRYAGWIVAFIVGFIVSTCFEWNREDVASRHVSAQADPDFDCKKRKPGNVSGYSEGDVNGDGDLNLSDAVALLNHLFIGAPGPVARKEFPVKTVIFTRHAEKDGNAANAPLAPEGHERAKVFGKMLEMVDVDVYLASERDRTIDTLVPLAELQGKSRTDIEQISAVCDVVDRIDRMPHGSTAVVAHHSFTLHKILRELHVPDGAHTEISLSGGSFDNWLVVEIPVDATPELMNYKYPEIPEPPDPGGQGGGLRKRRR